jgi:hypothetical protein
MMALRRAEVRQESCVWFEAIRCVGARERALDAFVARLRSQGYSIRDVMLDADTVLRYRVFLPRGSRMEDKTQ